MKIIFIDKVLNSERSKIDGGDANIVIHTDINNIHVQIYEIESIAKFFLPLYNYLGKSVVINVANYFCLNNQMIQYYVEIEVNPKLWLKFEVITYVGILIDNQLYRIIFNNCSFYVPKLVGVIEYQKMIDGNIEFPFHEYITDYVTNTCYDCIYYNRICYSGHPFLKCAVNPQSQIRCKEYVVR